MTLSQRYSKQVEKKVRRSFFFLLKTLVQPAKQLRGYPVHVSVTLTKLGSLGASWLMVRHGASTAVFFFFFAGRGVSRQHFSV